MDDKELILSLRRLEKNIRRYRKANRLRYYNTEAGKVHHKQIAFHQSQNRNRWVFGGNRSGKTECGAAEAVYLARGIHPYRKNRPDVSGWVVSLSNQVQRDVAQSKILDYVNPGWIESVVMVSGKCSAPRGGVIDYIVIKNVFGGTSRIGFKSCEMGREKFQGASLDFVWFDEEPPADIYEECRMRVIDRKGCMFGTMTPLKGLTFIYRKIYLNEGNDPEVWHISMEWADNPFLDAGEIEAVSRTMSESELASRRYGKFAASEGLVYYEFDEAVHVIEPFPIPKEWYDKLSIDPGLNNPLSCHWYAVSPDGVVYVAAEHYRAGKDIDWHAEAIKAQCKSLEWPVVFGGRYEALIDSAAGQRTLSAQKSVTELFFERGIAANPNVDKDIFAEIARVKSFLAGARSEGLGETKNDKRKTYSQESRSINDGWDSAVNEADNICNSSIVNCQSSIGAPRLFIFKSCVNLIREFKSYFWQGGDTPQKKDDHALDELRYYLMSRPKLYEEKAGKSAIQLDKERLLSRRGRRRGY